MKKRYLMSAILGSTLLLGACNQGDDDSKDHSDKKETSHKTEDKKSHKDNGSKSKNHSSKSKDDDSKSHSSKHQEQKFDKKQHIAMALYAPGADKYSITAKELLDGEYDAPQIGNTNNTNTVSNLTLTKDSSSVTNTPDNVTFYKTNPSKPDSVSLIGVSDKEIILFGSQSTATYDEVKQQGKVFNIKDLEKKYGDEKDLDKVAKKINISESEQIKSSDQSTTQNQNNNDNSSTSNEDNDQSDDNNQADDNGEITRENVFDKIEAHEGHKMDTEHYTYGEPEGPTTSGKWGVTIKDKQGKYVGYYTLYGDGSMDKEIDGKRTIFAK
ncbi:hypothetical protein [Staphylococcus pettenkoferi]|uniref:Lipoprotein n=1 Tax=Staphylococcus pettenkoferi TaxID=170573 RepID=A0A9Q4H2W1_9STAP|nr:hypothetical protein [Staphylococcus pettenkoferi]MCY1568784.1 hypothetical protein [Staphylococcus pettenkoferi]MCY1595543.1 hypothetical protein [Staphylococcus pettenkoferi]MCY1617540.1 hypothetical protein [Staphylococcus pettenkoferi]